MNIVQALLDWIITWTLTDTSFSWDACPAFHASTKNVDSKCIPLLTIIEHCKFAINGEYHLPKKE